MTGNRERERLKVYYNSITALQEPWLLPKEIAIYLSKAVAL